MRFAARIPFLVALGCCLIAAVAARAAEIVVPLDLSVRHDEPNRYRFQLLLPDEVAGARAVELEAWGFASRGFSKCLSGPGHESGPLVGAYLRAPDGMLGGWSGEMGVPEEGAFHVRCPLESCHLADPAVRLHDPPWGRMVEERVELDLWGNDSMLITDCGWVEAPQATFRKAALIFTVDD